MGRSAFRPEKPLVRGGQGHTAEDVAFSALAFSLAWLGMMVVLALAALIHVVR